jgi:4-hydroxy-3-methylbut-2-enyl diphosphate reductase
VSLEVRRQAEEKQLKIFDATCPLVTKVHFEVKKYSKDGCDCILIGHLGHPEVEGTMGQFDSSNGGKIHLVQDVNDVDILKISQPENVAYVTQTTLSMDDTSAIIDALREKYPKIIGPKKNDICYATQNRQDAVKQLAIEADVVLVVGSSNSSNSNRLRELAENCGCLSYLIDGPEDIKPGWFSENCVVGITAGASAPEILVDGVVDKLVSMGASKPDSMDGIKEDIYFSIPRELRA